MRLPPPLSGPLHCKGREGRVGRVSERQRGREDAVREAGYRLGSRSDARSSQPPRTRYKTDRRETETDTRETKTP